jgi:hypothetical protein
MKHVSTQLAEGRRAERHAEAERARVAVALRRSRRAQRRLVVARAQAVAAHDAMVEAVRATQGAPYGR